MSDLNLIPSQFHKKSLSRREIVLLHEDIIEVVEILKTYDIAVLGWEGWIKYSNGKVGHSEKYQGTVMI